jgi:hypothetical protein
MTAAAVSTTPATTHAGVFARWRSRLFGDRDPVEQQLADIACEGAAMARVAHLCASALLILFSAASFVALGSDAYAEISAQWRPSTPSMSPRRSPSR